MKPILILLALCIGMFFFTTAYSAPYDVPTMCEVAAALHAEPVDLPALSRAVAVAETGNCTAGVGISKNNCHSIRRNGEYVTFASPADSHQAFQRMWSNSWYYSGSFPTCEEARIYKGDPDIQTWMSHVLRVYLK